MKHVLWYCCTIERQRPPSPSGPQHRSIDIYRPGQSVTRLINVTPLPHFIIFVVRCHTATQGVLKASVNKEVVHTKRIYEISYSNNRARNSKCTAEASDDAGPRKSGTEIYSTVAIQKHSSIFIFGLGSHDHASSASGVETSLL